MYTFVPSQARKTRTFLAISSKYRREKAKENENEKRDKNKQTNKQTYITHTYKQTNKETKVEMKGKKGENTKRKETQEYSISKSAWSPFSFVQHEVVLFCLFSSVSFLSFCQTLFLLQPIHLYIFHISSSCSWKWLKSAQGRYTSKSEQEIMVRATDVVLKREPVD